MHSADLPGALIRMQRQVQDAMQALIDAKLVTVRRENMWLEIEINADILFPSGSGEFTTAAEPVLDKLAEVLKPFPNPIRVEGHTDDRPIKTAAIPVQLGIVGGACGQRGAPIHAAGRRSSAARNRRFREFHPRQSNSTSEGRNANRRVVILVLEEVPARSETTTVRTNDQTPDNVTPPGVDIAESNNAANRMIERVPPASLDTVLIKEQVTPQSNAATHARSERGHAMSEVDRLSNSGLYPALPIADKRPSRADRRGRRATTNNRPTSPHRRRAMVRSPRLRGRPNLSSTSTHNRGEADLVWRLHGRKKIA